MLPETEAHSFNEWGPDKASFVLRRSPWVAWPDLSPFTPVEIEIGGVIVWEGRTGPTPLKAGTEQQVSVQCEGWQYNLDDNAYKHLYVHSTLTDWKDVRSHLEANLASWPAAWQVQVEAGVIVLSIPKGTVVENGHAAGIVLDLGEAAASAIHLQTGETKGFSAGEYSLFWRVSETPEMIPLSGTTEEGNHQDPSAFPAGFPFSTSFSTPRRYVSLFLWREGGTATVAADQTLKITGLIVNNVGVGEEGPIASDVVADVFQHVAPFISSDHSQINPFAGTGQPELEDSFHIPSLVMASYKTGRQMIDAVNAFKNWTTKIDLARRMVFAPRASEPLLEFGAWSGEDVEDASAGEGGEIYNVALLEGSEADGDPLNERVETTGSIVSQRHFRRAKVISLSNTSTPTVAEKLGEVFLAGHQSTPYGGAIKATPGSVRMVLGGQPVHPSLLGRYSQELIRVSHAIDPNTGGVGRDGRIVAVSYSHATQSAQISLDSRLDNYEALVQRLAVVAEAGG